MRSTVFILIICSLAYSRLIWVDDNGAATFTNAISVSPLSGDTATAMTAFNASAVAGDTAMVRGGTYAVAAATWFKPVNAGTNGNPIVIKVYSDEVVVVDGDAENGTSSYGIHLEGVSYIVVDGGSMGQLRVQHMRTNLIVGTISGDQTPDGPTTYNEIKYLWAYNGYATADWAYHYQGCLMSRSVSLNHIHHCKFEKWGYMIGEDGGNIGNVFDMGVELADLANERTYNNVLEYNEFLSGGHATFGFFGDHNIVRNNYFHNEGWYSHNDTLYAYRNVIGNGAPEYMGYSVFEGNRIGHAAPNITWVDKLWYWGGQGMKLCHPNNIVRQNSFFGNSSGSFEFGEYDPPKNAKGMYNHVYNNTIFSGGYYQKLPTAEYRYTYAIGFGYTGGGDWTVMYGSVFKNNLLYQIGIVTEENGIPWEIGNESDINNAIDPDSGNVTIENNYNAPLTYAAETDPLFVDEDLTDPTSWTLPNLNLQSGSPCVDNASYLTQSSGSGTDSDTLTVDDAWYFQDGNFGGAAISWPTTVAIEGDWIAVGTVNDTVQIDSIDYTNNKIVLASAMTWSDNAGVWLYKNSSGTRVLYGDNADYGSSERVVGEQPIAATNELKFWFGRKQ